MEKNENYITVEKNSVKMLQVYKFKIFKLHEIIDDYFLIIKSQN